MLVQNALTNSAIGFEELLTDMDAGKAAYSENILIKEKAGETARNWPSLFFNLFFDCTSFLFFYFCTQKDKKRFFLIVLFAALLLGMVVPVLRGQRGSVVQCSFSLVMAYFLFSDYLSRRFNRIARLTGILLVIAISIPIVAITVSRFSDRKDSGVQGYVCWYMGQANLYFNSSAMDAGGIRYGDRTTNMVKRLFWSDTPKNYAERRNKYPHLKIDDYYFVTFVGDFVIDFGPIAAVVIFVLFNLWACLRIRPRDGTIRLHQLLLVYFTLCICMQGGMTLFTYSDGGNLVVVVLLLLYLWFKYYRGSHWLVISKK